MTEMWLFDITIDNRFQMRANGLDADAVQSYTQAYQSGATMPPLTVAVLPGRRSLLVDGFHRAEAAKLAGLAEVEVNQVEVPDETAALLIAVQANQQHGLRRTRADKRRAVIALLENADAQRYSDRDIAKLAGVTHPTVARIREEQSGKFTTEDGTAAFFMRTSQGDIPCPPVRAGRMYSRFGYYETRQDGHVSFVPLAYEVQLHGRNLTALFLLDCETGQNHYALIDEEVVGLTGDPIAQRARVSGEWKKPVEISNELHVVLDFSRCIWSIVDDIPIYFKERSLPTFESVIGAAVAKYGLTRQILDASMTLQAAGDAI